MLDKPKESKSRRDFAKNQQVLSKIQQVFNRVQQRKEIGKTNSKTKSIFIFFRRKAWFWMPYLVVFRYSKSWKSGKWAKTKRILAEKQQMLTKTQQVFNKIQQRKGKERKEKESTNTNTTCMCLIFFDKKFQ